MLTVLLMYLQKVSSVNFILTIFLISWIIYAALYFIVKANRKPKQIRSAFTTGAVVTLVFDVLWLFNFFEDFKYLDPGVKGMFWVLAFPAVLLILVMALSYINVNVDAHERKKQIKEDEKERKKESRRQKFENKEEK